MIQLYLSSQSIYCFTDGGCQYVCSRKGLFLPPMSTPGAMSLFSAQTPWTAVNRFRLSLLSLKISSYLQAGANRTLLKTFFENHPVFMRYQLYLTSTLTLIYRAWKFWQNWECNIRCHKNSQLDCSKHLSQFSAVLLSLWINTSCPWLCHLSTNFRYFHQYLAHLGEWLSRSPNCQVQ